MKKAIGWKRKIRNISIAKKLYFIVGTMAILIVIELFSLWFAIHTLSSVRAFIGAEGLWSKAQKDAVYQLGKYNRTHNDVYYDGFRKFMKVPEGDHRAKLELYKKDPDLAIVRAGFLEGRVHPDDIDGMVRLVRRFSNTYYIHKALGYWGEGDSLIAHLVPISEEIKNDILSGEVNTEKTNQVSARIDIINQQLTHVEDSFSFALEEGSRWLENLVLKLLFSIALTVEITGLIFTVLVTRNITKGLNEINRAADKITNGNLEERATVFSTDEIGQVATSVNRMTEQLIISNQELQKFAYIASHDLQEPLRKIVIYTDLLNIETGNLIEEKGHEYMKKITESVNRMRRLIEDILHFAAISPAVDFVLADMNKIVMSVVNEMEATVSKTNATIHIGTLPQVEANISQVEQLFQNLIGNALKFTKDEPVINISAEIINRSELPEHYLATRNIRTKLPEKFCRIYVKDNGIGFNEIYLDKIFMAFQRLHGKHVYEGTGIGLAICQKIVDNHHGIISAESAPGKGATFIITLPLTQKGFENS